jgi:uncharacterized protein (DUF305 family)
MKTAHLLLAPLLAGSALFLSSCDNAAQTDAATSAAEPATTTATAPTLADSSHSSPDQPAPTAPSAAPGMQRIMNRTMQGMHAAQPVGNVDHDFAQLMLDHHKGAVEMAALELKEGKDSTLRAMAEKISTSQQQEIRVLQASVSRLAAAPATDPQDPFTAKLHASMAGMMKTISQPTGNADKDFVLLMMPHHQSAIDLAQAELDHGRDAELKALASKVMATQRQEFKQLKDWQLQYGGKN